MEEAPPLILSLVLRLLGVTIPSAAQLDAIDAHMDTILAAEAPA